MYYRSPWIIIFFVAASMTLAVVYTKYFAGGTRGVASQNAQSMDAQAMMGKISKAGGRLENIGTLAVSGEDDYAQNCNCEAGGHDRENYSFEDETKCSDDRKMYEHDFENNSKFAAFRTDRDASPTNFSRTCVTFIMHQYGTTWNSVHNKPTKEHDFGSCATKAGKPEHSTKAPCMSKSYVNVVYNTYGDLWSCLNQISGHTIDPKELLPQLSQESGMHLNTLETNGWDAGFSQITGDGIETCNQHFDEYKKLIAANAENITACRNINAQLKDLKQIPTIYKHEKNGSVSLDSQGKPVSDPGANRCEFITSPKNPLLSMYCGAMIQIENRQTTAAYFKNKEFNVKMGHQTEKNVHIRDLIRRNISLVDSAIAEMHLPPTEENEVEDAIEYIYGKLVAFESIHAYNMGAEKAVHLLGQYLVNALETNQHLSLDDFNFHLVGTKYQSMNQFRDGVKAKVEAKRPLSYPEYIFAHYPPDAGGAKSYLIEMAEQADELQKAFSKENMCVPEKFLAL